MIQIVETQALIALTKLGGATPHFTNCLPLPPRKVLNFVTQVLSFLPTLLPCGCHFNSLFTQRLGGSYSLQLSNGDIVQYAPEFFCVPARGLDEQMLRSDLSVEHAKFTLCDTAMTCSEANRTSDVSWEQFQLRIDGNIPVQENQFVQVDCT